MKFTVTMVGIAGYGRLFQIKIFKNFTEKFGSKAPPF